jgi:hypothetical protein
MAEQEVIKHTKKVYKIWNSREHSLSHKIREFIMEVLIIVFAVSLSIWLHGWSEHRAEQKKVKSFLVGLKNDLQEDAAEARQIIQEFKTFGSVYTYLSDLPAGAQPANKDSFNLAMEVSESNIWLRPNTSRYEGFKSSGNLSYIENDSLLQKILFLYQEALPQIKSSEGGWLEAQARFKAFLYDGISSNSSVNNTYQLVTSFKGKRLTNALKPYPQLYERYENFIVLSEQIIDVINKMYDLPA